MDKQNQAHCLIKDWMLPFKDQTMYNFQMFKFQSAYNHDKNVRNIINVGK
jgi:hypothetical protein